MGSIVKVGMADYKIARVPDKLLTAGLGSCIGICIWDKFQKIGAMAHIMLPSSQAISKNQNKAKFADSALEIVLDELYREGANKAHLIAKIAGGAQMFKLQEESDIMKIGQRNAEAVEDNLNKHRVKIIARDVGGNFGRTIIFDPGSGDLLVKTIGHGERII